MRKNIKKIIDEIIKDTENSDDFDTICFHLARVIKSDLSDQNMIFVFDNLQNFEFLKIFIAKFEGINNIQILVTTKDNNFKVKLSNLEFKDFRIKYFNCNQARQFLEKSLNKKYSMEKHIVVQKVLKSENAFSPHTLNSIVNFINNTDFDIQEFLEKPICEISHIYFRYFEKIEMQNENSMKILYYMSLMDPDRIPSFLINDLFKNDLDIELLQEAIDVLIQMGFIESIKSDKLKYFRIHGLIQATSKVFRKKNNMNFEIENKLLSSLNKLFTAEIDICFFTIKEKSCQLVSHVHKLISFTESLGIKIFNDRREYFKLKLNFGIYFLQEEECSQNRELKGIDYKKILDECYREFGNVDDFLKLQICHALGFHYWKIEFKQQEALRYFKEGLSISKTLYSNNNYLIVIALYEVAFIYFEMDFYDPALRTAREAYEMCEQLTNDNKLQKFTILSLIIRILFKLNDFSNANQRLGELIKIHESHRYEDPLKCAKHKLDDIAENLSYLGHNQKALDYALEALKIYKENLSSHDSRFIGISLSVAKMYRKCNDDNNSKVYLDESLELLMKCKLPENSSELVFLYNHIGILLHSFHRYDEAIIHLKNYYLYMKENRCKNTTTALSYLSDCYVEKNEFEDAIKYYRELIDIDKNIYPSSNADSPRSILTMLENNLNKKRKN